MGADRQQTNRKVVQRVEIKDMNTSQQGKGLWECRVLSHFSCVQLLETSQTVTRRAPLSMGFSGQEYWSGLPCPPPGDLPDPGTEPVFLSLLHGQAGSLPLALPGSVGQAEILNEGAQGEPESHNLEETKK